MNKLKTTEQAKELKTMLPLGTHYFKCVVREFDALEVKEEFWGYHFGTLKEAKKDFLKELDENLDALDYGFIVIHEYIASNENGKFKGKHVSDYVCNYGKWYVYKR